MSLSRTDSSWERATASETKSRPFWQEGLIRKTFTCPNNCVQLQTPSIRCLISRSMASRCFLMGRTIPTPIGKTHTAKADMLASTLCEATVVWKWRVERDRPQASRVHPAARERAWGSPGCGAEGWEGTVVFCLLGSGDWAYCLPWFSLKSRQECPKVLPASWVSKDTAKNSVTSGSGTTDLTAVAKG